MDITVLPLYSYCMEKNISKSAKAMWQQTPKTSDPWKDLEEVESALSCPVCGKELSFKIGQARRGEVVTCSCGAKVDIQLSLRDMRPVKIEVETKYIYGPAVTIEMKKPFDMIFEYFSRAGAGPPDLIIRTAIAEYYKRSIEADLDREYIEAYKKEPEDTTLGEAQEAIIRELLAGGEI